MREQHSVIEMGKQVVRDFPTVLEKSLATPELMHDALHYFVQGKMQQKNQMTPVTEATQLRRSYKGWIGFVIGVVLTAAFFYFHP